MSELIDIDLAEILPEEMFDEIPTPPDALMPLSRSLYQSNCPELLGNYFMELYTDGSTFYVKRFDKEPIGDYGSRWVYYWYRCNDNDTVRKIIAEAGSEADAEDGDV